MTDFFDILPSYLFHFSPNFWTNMPIPNPEIHDGDSWSLPQPFWMGILLFVTTNFKPEYSINYKIIQLLTFRIGCCDLWFQKHGGDQSLCPHKFGSFIVLKECYKELGFWVHWIRVITQTWFLLEVSIYIIYSDIYFVHLQKSW